MQYQIESITVVPSLQPVVTSNFEDMLALRIEVLCDSLTRLGIFSPERARERFANAFMPVHMQHIMVKDKRVGFITFRPAPDIGNRLYKIEHLYVVRSTQNSGVGAWVLNWAKANAQQERSDIVLSALKQSDANRFYVRYGFVQVSDSEFDIDYRWNHVTGVGV